jgi:hypothetical protein
MAVWMPTSLVDVAFRLDKTLLARQGLYKIGSVLGKDDLKDLLESMSQAAIVELL